MSRIGPANESERRAKSKDLENEREIVDVRKANNNNTMQQLLTNRYEAVAMYHTYMHTQQEMLG